jgi:hypothetical protein
MCPLEQPEDEDLAGFHDPLVLAEACYRRAVPRPSLARVIGDPVRCAECPPPLTGIGLS